MSSINSIPALLWSLSEEETMTLVEAEQILSVHRSGGDDWFGADYGMNR